MPRSTLRKVTASDSCGLDGPSVITLFVRPSSRPKAPAASCSRAPYRPKAPAWAKSRTSRRALILDTRTRRLLLLQHGRGNTTQGRFAAHDLGDAEKEGGIAVLRVACAVRAQQQLTQSLPLRGCHRRQQARRRGRRGVRASASCLSFLIWQAVREPLSRRCGDENDETNHGFGRGEISEKL